MSKREEGGSTMAEDRLKALLAIAEAQPDEVMIWYGLANEYVKLERWPEAVEALRRTVTLNPDYTSAYQMLGTSLMNLDQRDAARLAWTQGVEVAGRTGAWKAREHMERLLADVGEGSGLCKE
jgi:Flp pilus assembly protein TadD